MNKWLEKLSFSEKIWRLSVDPHRDELLIETRDATQKQARFFFTTRRNPQRQVLSLDLPDPWWVSLYAGWQGHLILQGYADPTLPVPQGIYVYDRSTGLLRWSDPQRRCTGLSADGILTRHPQLPQRLEQLALEDGQPTVLFPEAWHLAREQGESLQFADLRFPEACLPHQLPLSLPLDPEPLPEWPVDYLACPDDLHLMAWYAPQANQPQRMSQHLAIWRHQQLVFTTRIQTDLSQFAPDSFMLYRDTLVWHDDQQQLYLGDLGQR
jgi:hypothetical protein